MRRRSDPKPRSASDEGISSGRLLSFHMMLLFLQEDSKISSEIPRVLRTHAFACSFHSTRKSSTTASPSLRMTDKGLSCETRSRRINIKTRYSRFFFCPCRPKRKSLAKRKRPGEYFARCDARPRLRALDGRPLAWGLFPKRGAVRSRFVRRITALSREATRLLCFGRALARRSFSFLLEKSGLNAEKNTQIY